MAFIVKSLWARSVSRVASPGAEPRYSVISYEPSSIIAVTVPCPSPVGSILTPAADNTETQAPIGQKTAKSQSCGFLPIAMSRIHPPTSYVEIPDSMSREDISIAPSGIESSILVFMVLFWFDVVGTFFLLRWCSFSNIPD